MEIQILTISILLFIVLILVPVILFLGIKKVNWFRFRFVAYTLIGFFISGLVTMTFAWWMNYSEWILMNHYGYDFNALSEAERFTKVDNQNIERVKQLEFGYYGIGWPLKAIMMFVFYFPYLLIVYLIGHYLKVSK